MYNTPPETSEITDDAAAKGRHQIAAIQFQIQQQILSFSGRCSGINLVSEAAFFRFTTLIFLEVIFQR